MRPMDAQNRPPEVATDQFALDRTLKHLRKLRKLKKSSPCWLRRRQTVQTTTPGTPFVSLSGHICS
jgi:hypothetical protein